MSHPAGKRDNLLIEIFRTNVLRMTGEKHKKKDCPFGEDSLSTLNVYERP